MPVISMFYGIIVLMDYFDNRTHQRPHIHVQYSDQEAAVISIPDGEVIEGSLHRTKLKLVQAWVELHRDELMADWTLAVTGQPVFRIDPLNRSQMIKVVAVKANSDYTLDLKFSDGSVKRFDVKPYLKYDVFTELRDLSYFQNVTIAFGTVQWPHQQDIAPDTLFLEGHAPTENLSF